MSLKSNIQKVLTGIKGKKATIPVNSTYDSRSRFNNNAKQSTHGIKQRSSRGSYNYQTRSQGADRPSLVLQLPYEIVFMQRKRGNSGAYRRDIEVKFIDDNTLMMQVTTDYYNMQDGPSPGRWNYDESDATHSVDVGESIKTTEEIYLIRCDESMPITIEDNKLIIGSAGDATKTKVGDKLTYKDSASRSLMCIELKGANAKIWEEEDATKVSHILNPQVTYVSPTFEEAPRKGLLKSVRKEESLDIAGLSLHKLSDEIRLSNVTGKLTTALNTDNLIISCDLCKGTVLTYVNGETGATESRDVEAGQYSVLLKKMNSKSRSLSKYRKKVLKIAREVTIDFTVDRLDFLTALDLEKDEIRTDSNLEGRVDSGASIAIDNDVESVDTDKLVGRVSIINLDED